MKNYKAPEREIVKFSHEDIMTTSNPDALQVANKGTGAETGEYVYESNGGEVKYGTFIQ